MFLPGQVLELGHARVGVVVGIIDHRHRLVERLVERLELELQRSIRQAPESIIEVRVDWTGVDERTIRDDVFHFAEVAVEQHLDVRVRQHALKHPRVPVQRHGLVRVGEVPIVPIGSHRDARGHLRLQLGRIEPPLLARVVLEKFLVQLAADLADDDVFRGLHALAPLGALGEELRQLL